MLRPENLHLIDEPCERSIVLMREDLKRAVECDPSDEVVRILERVQGELTALTRELFPC